MIQSPTDCWIQLPVEPPGCSSFIRFRLLLNDFRWNDPDLNIWSFFWNFGAFIHVSVFHHSYISIGACLCASSWIGLCFIFLWDGSEPLLLTHGGQSGVGGAQEAHIALNRSFSVGRDGDGLAPPWSCSCWMSGSLETSFDLEYERIWEGFTNRSYTSASSESSGGGENISALVVRWRSFNKVVEEEEEWNVPQQKFSRLIQEESLNKTSVSGLVKVERSSQSEPGVYSSASRSDLTVTS